MEQPTEGFAKSVDGKDGPYGEESLWRVAMLGMRRIATPWYLMKLVRPSRVTGPWSVGMVKLFEAFG
jgi:hypothetical protein